MPVFLNTTDPDFETAFQTLLGQKREEAEDVDVAVAQIIADVRKFVEPLDGVTAVDVNWVWDPPWGPDKMTDDGKRQMRMFGFNV